ncbi:MAG TPA: hypothetical protein VN418_05275 [Gammaproteobacteria bacterium]|nr:hypothetical protein [Gammaproteobacteria bacterium]
MKRSASFSILIGCIVLYGCASLDLREALIMPVDTTWDLVYIQGDPPSPIVSSSTTPFLAAILPPVMAPSLMMDLPNKNVPVILEYVPDGQTLDNWSELLTIQYLGPAAITPHVLMEQARDRMQTRCPNVFWEIISQDAGSVLYEWRISQCPTLADQHEVARLMRGIDGLHRVAYVAKVTELSQQQRGKWIKTFSEAYIEKNDKKVSTSPPLKP